MLEGYIKDKRSKIGNDLLIHPAARIIIENKNGDFLFIIRADNGNLGLPAGGLEENETITECIIRETKEETGLIISDVTVIGISTTPTLETVEYANGDKTQYFAVEFYTNQFSGELIADGKETQSVDFKPIEYVHQLPPNEQSTFKSLAFYRKTGQICVK